MADCNLCKHSENWEYSEPCFSCNHGSNWERKPMTNADKIRGKTDEEMADWLSYICDAYYEPDNGWLNWLKQEVE
jgi:hypothetical protein